MQVIGLLGGVASGKSLVARQFVELGARIVDADAAGHRALRLPQVEAHARQRWGERVFGPDGHLDRARIAEIVFAPGETGRKELETLEQWTHPEIERQLRAELDRLAASGVKAAVLDAAIMFEAGWHRLCDWLFFVDMAEAQRLAWAKTRGWTEEQWRARESAQQPLETKRQAAHAVIDNSGTPDQTQSQVERWWQIIAAGGSAPQK